MYASTRVMHARVSRLGDAIRIVKLIAERLNSQLGTNYRASVNLGNEAGMVLLAGNYEHLKEIEKVRETLWKDPDIAAALRFSEEVFQHGAGSTFDHIEKVHQSSGDHKDWVTVKTRRSKPGMRREAVTVGVELAKYMSELLKHPIGFATAITGDLNRALWIGNSDSLADLERDGQILVNDKGYSELIQKVHTVFDAGTQVRSIWQRVH